MPDVIELENWLSEIERRVADAGLQTDAVAHARGRFGAPALAERGFPGAVPLWRGTGALVALVPLPKVLPQHWPVIIEEDGESLLLATDAQTALPRFWMLRVLAEGDPEGTSLACHWSRETGPLVGLHRALGGTRGSLAAVAEAVSDPVRREALIDRPGGSEAFERTFGELARKVDTSRELANFADWLDDARGTEAPAFPSTELKLGPWRKQATYWAAKAIPRCPLIPQDDVLMGIEAFAGVGSGVPVRASWSAQPGAASGAATHAALGRRADPDEVEDEVQSGLLAAIQSEGMDYDGYAHAEAVVALDEGGEPERAWGALHSAAWWGANNQGTAPPAMLDGGRMLAERHGWMDIGWALDRAASSLGEEA